MIKYSLKFMARLIINKFKFFLYFEWFIGYLELKSNKLRILLNYSKL